MTTLAFTAQTTPFDGGGLIGVCWSATAGLFVAVGANAAGNRAIMTSPDAVTWTAQTSGFNTGNGEKVCWSEDQGLFVAVGTDAFPSTVQILTSPDGLAPWTAQTNNFTAGRGTGIAWSSDLGLFVAGGFDAGTDRIQTSPDGSAWTTQTSPWDAEFSTSLFPVWIQELGLFLVFGNGTPQVASSPDATAWTSAATPFDGATGGVWSSELGDVIATGNDGALTLSTMTSPDGLAPWTGQAHPVTFVAYAIAKTSLLYVVGGQSADTVEPLSVSDDGGATWVPTASPFTASAGTVFDMCWSPELELLVVVGNDTDSGLVVATATETSDAVTQYLRIYGWRVNISDDALETVDPLMVSPETGSA